MSPSEEGELMQLGTWEYWVVNGDTTHKRKKGTEEWKSMPLGPDPPASPSDKHTICLVRQFQSTGEPKHWSIFIYPGEDEPSEGLLLQVKGDATFMTYHLENNVNKTASASFADHYELGKITTTQRNRVQEIASGQTPPRAKTRKDVKENCQGWSIRVLQIVADEGIIGSSKVASLKPLMEKV